MVGIPPISVIIRTMMIVGPVPMVAMVSIWSAMMAAMVAMATMLGDHVTVLILVALVKINVLPIVVVQVVLILVALLKINVLPLVVVQVW